MKLSTIICAAVACGSAWAADESSPIPASADGQREPAVQLEEKEDSPLVSIEAGVSLDSRYMTYGVIDGKDPILTPSAQVKFFDWAYIGVESIFDLTKGNGKRGGYGNRAGKYTTLDGIVGLAHEFDLGESLGTLGVDVNYIYEYIPRHHGSMDDTQYLNLELSLGGHWLEPTLAIERDLMADDGTYANLALGHTFALVGDEEDPTLTFKPSVAQGLGDKHRTRGYELADDHGGVMDTTIKGEFEWTICENLALSAYIAYSDYWFDSKLRDGARDYNGAWGSSCDHSWNFYGGVSLTVSF